MTEPSGEDEVRLTIWIRGRVQGVGMRWWIRSRALELGLTGWARNLLDGRVEVLTEGPRADCAALLALLDAGAFTGGGLDITGPRARPGRIDSVVERWSDAQGLPHAGGGGFVER